MEEARFLELKEKCQLLFKSILIELTICDDDMTNIYQCRHHELPVFLTDYIQKNMYEIEQSMKTNGSDKVYYFSNGIMMTFICIGLFETEAFIGAVVAGPFISGTNYKQLIHKIVRESGLPVDSSEVLNHYYQSLPIIHSPQKQYLGQLILNTLVNRMVKGEVHNELSEESGLLNLIKTWRYDENLEVLKAHQRFEDKLLYAIERGLIKEALSIHSQRKFTIDSVMYLNNSFKNGKNILMVANTLYARAAQRGGVSLVYSDSLSSKFIVLIERAKTMEELQQLSKKMIVDYCECVNKFAIRGYTPIIRQAMDYIQQRLKEDIALQRVAEHLKLNKSYLSKLFRHEVGVTLTDYIHAERIKRACYILEYENLSITEVASVVGYDDPNYFTRMFKKHKGTTPTQYTKQCL